MHTTRPAETNSSIGTMQGKQFYKAFFLGKQQVEITVHFRECIYLGEKTAVLGGLMSHFFHASIFSPDVQVKLLLHFFLFCIDCIVYFIVVLEISFLPREDVDVNMRNRLARFRTILNRECEGRSFVVLLELRTNFLCS